MAVISFSRRLRELAEAQPDRPAITCGDDTVTRAELVQRGDDLAVYLHQHGVRQGDMVTIAVPNSIDWFVAYVAAWRLGATPQPISWRLPQRELDAIMELADPSAVIGVDPALDDPALAGRCRVPFGFRAPRAEASHLPDVVSPAWKAPTSGGSTGRPKLIVSGDPASIDTDAPPPLLLGSDGCLVMPGPLYHNGPGVWSCQALLHGNHVALLHRFDAEATLAAIQEHRGTVLYMVPTMMKRIWRLPDDVREAYDLASLRVVWHLAEPCPEWLKQVWIDWLGAERIYELYAGTEAQTATVITGPDWLAHRGSVGRAQPGTVMITDADGSELPAGEMGEVWLRAVGRDTPTYRYLGAAARTREGGWESLGDMGYLDADDYLYLGDRAADMILSGGANIYPAEIEAALQEHAGIHSCAVIGLPDEDKGNVVHAILEADPTEVDEAELKQFLAERLVVYKLPRTFEYVQEPLRDDAGKVRRNALRQERIERGQQARQPHQPHQSQQGAQQ
ncbi:MAG: AMP-binding protein [Acidimicrobiaceae bacterium]|nr:AMP-binding protein [Acidimicrobiaceae bacterium]